MINLSMNFTNRFDSFDEFYPSVNTDGSNVSIIANESKLPISNYQRIWSVGKIHWLINH